MSQNATIGSYSINHRTLRGIYASYPVKSSFFILLSRLICRSDAYAVESLDENGSRQDALRSLSRRLERLWKIHETLRLFVTDCCTKCINHACINTPCEAYVYVTQENDKKIIGINLGIAERLMLLRTERNTVSRKNKNPRSVASRINFRFTDCAALLSRTHEYATVTSRECAFNEAEITRLLSSL